MTTMGRGYGLVLLAALTAACTASSYGGSDADPTAVYGPNKPKAKKADAGAGADVASGATNQEETKSDNGGPTNRSDPTKPTDPTNPSDPTKPTDPTAPRALEVAAYYAGYTSQTLPMAKLDLKLVDELTHFAVVPRADGSLDDGTNMVFSESSLEVVSAARAAKVRATLCVGGAGSGASFALAAKDHRTELVNRIASYVKDRGYDGVDVDWEPLAPQDAGAFVALIRELRAKLGLGKTITAAVPVGEGALVAPAAGDLDRIHLMSYDLAGPYPGWVTWHNGALYSGGATFPSSGGALPSVEGAISELLVAGIPASKVMLGVSHVGYAWKGGAGEDGSALVAPRMTWSAAPIFQPVPFRDIADKLLTPARAKWDDVAKAPFLSIDEAGTTEDQFITYEDEKSQREKVTFARDEGLAGIFVWDISAGYRPGQAAPLALVQSLHHDAKAE